MATAMRRTGILSGGKHRIVWVQRDLFRGLTWFKEAVEGGVEQVVREVSKEAEDYMKQNAPWRDRTRDARRTLSASSYQRGEVKGILLAHGVDYGRWLELRWGGRYAIILPTLEVMGQRLMERLADNAFNNANGVPIGSSDSFGELE